MLPKIDAPIYSLTLPLCNKKIEYRPFLVKEQKILMMALESDEKDSMEKATRQVLRNCTLTDIDIDNVPLVDIEFYFLNLRAKSSGEISELVYKCGNVINDKKCDNRMEVNVNLLDIKVEKNNTVSDLIQLTPAIGIKMKYPTYSIMNQLNSDDDIHDIAINTVVECIDYVYDQDVIYHTKDVTKKELCGFIESLNADQFKKIENFLDNLPQLKKKIEVDCKKCGFHHEINIEGIESFFA